MDDDRWLGVMRIVTFVFYFVGAWMALGDLY